MLLIDFDFTYSKRCNILILTSRYGKFNQENVYKLYQKRPCFVKDTTKTFRCVFRFTALNVHLQNANAKFHKVGYRHYSGEAENVYISV